MANLEGADGVRRILRARLGREEKAAKVAYDLPPEVDEEGRIAVVTATGQVFMTPTDAFYERVSAKRANREDPWHLANKYIDTYVQQGEKKGLPALIQVSKTWASQRVSALGVPEPTASVVGIAPFSKDTCVVGSSGSSAGLGGAADGASSKAVPIKTANADTVSNALAVGDRVWARWQGPKGGQVYYAAVITGAVNRKGRSTEFSLKYDDDGKLERGVNGKYLRKMDESAPPPESAAATTGPHTSGSAGGTPLPAAHGGAGLVAGRHARLSSSSSAGAEGGYGSSESVSARGDDDLLPDGDDDGGYDDEADCVEEDGPAPPPVATYESSQGGSQGGLSAVPSLKSSRRKSDGSVSTLPAVMRSKPKATSSGGNSLEGASESRESSGLSAGASGKGTSVERGSSGLSAGASSIKATAKRGSSPDVSGGAGIRVAASDSGARGLSSSSTSAGLGAAVVSSGSSAGLSMAGAAPDSVAGGSEAQTAASASAASTTGVGAKRKHSSGVQGGGAKSAGSQATSAGGSAEAGEVVPAVAPEGSTHAKRARRSSTAAGAAAPDGGDSGSEAGSESSHADDGDGRTDAAVEPPAARSRHVRKVPPGAPKASTGSSAETGAAGSSAKTSAEASSSNTLPTVVNMSSDSAGSTLGVDPAMLSIVRAELEAERNAVVRLGEERRKRPLTVSEKIRLAEASSAAAKLHIAYNDLRAALGL